MRAVYADLYKQGGAPYLPNTTIVTGLGGAGKT